MFVFALTVFGYQVWKLVSRYVTAMDEHEASAKWSRANRTKAGSDA
jgi:hypothetical protein